MSDATKQLGELLEASGARIVFDRGNNTGNPCTFCGTRPAPSHETMQIGTYTNGDPIRRPVCDQCLPVAKARQAGESPAPAALPANTCPTCRRQQRAPGEVHDEGRHCPDSPIETREARDPVACFRIGIELRDAQQAKMKSLLRRVAQLLDDGVALIDAAANEPEEHR